MAGTWTAPTATSQATTSGTGKNATINSPQFGTFKLGKKGAKNMAITDYQQQQNQIMIDRQTEANRANQVTPEGKLTWNQDPTTGKWTQTTELTPEAQAAFDSQQRVKQGLSTAAEGMLGNVGDKYKTDMDWSGFQKPGAIPTAPGMGDFRATGSGPAFGFAPQGPGWQELAALGGGAVGGGAGAGQATTERAKEYELQKQLDMSKLTDMPVADDATRQRVEDAQYARAKSRLDPMWQQREASQLERLYAMGGREGDQNFDRGIENSNRERTDAYNQAIYESIASGGQEQERLFNMGMDTRKQGWEEALGQGNFANKALMDQFQQGAFNAGESNQTSRSNAANQTQASIASAGNATSASIANAGNRLRGAEIGLDYGLKSNELNNRYTQQGWENERSSSQDWNDLVQQAYGNERTQSGDQNAQRQRDIQEALAQRNQPLNELNALRSGNQVGGPQFGGYNQAGAAEAGDYYGAYQDNLARQAAEKQAAMSMYSGLASSAMGMFSLSDRRLKSNIVRIGTTPGGHGWYEYDIFGRREQGVMAQEVPAAWTALHPSGFLMVDYSKVL
jgi:hypothetical protein